MPHPSDAEIATKARFDHIRYAQVWEDADILVDALATAPGATLVSICSAGDNALAMLLRDPARVIAIDLSHAQLACLHARIAAMRVLDHAGFLALMGARRSDHRGPLFDRMLSALDGEDLRAFWAARRTDVLRDGLAGIGRFERYFALFRRWLLPLVHGRRRVDAIFVSKSQADRRRFLDRDWNNRRWRLLLGLFFSRTVMGRLGRDPAFFDHVDGSVAQHVARRIRHAAVDLDPADNPYLHWILKGCHGRALPLAWRAEHYRTIAGRLDRLEPRLGALEALASSADRADGFNLSDVFEYMDPSTVRRVYADILACANPGARLVYWNMMAPRRVPDGLRGQVRTCTDAERRGKAADKAFFYSDFVVEEVVAP